MREIGSGVYIEDSYSSGIVACATTEQGAVLIDSPMLPSDAWDWLRKTTSLSRHGIAILINTDYEVEHVLGNCFFPTNTIIAHQLAWLEMQRYDETYLQRYLAHHKEADPAVAADLAKVRIVPPELTLTRDVTVFKGDRVFRLTHCGGHTPASILVHMPQERILFAGDVVVTGQHPSLSQANTLRWLHALEMIRRMDDVDLIVPGHGELCDQSATEVLSDYISTMRERVYEHFSSGYTRRETVDKVKMQGFFSVPEPRREEVERRIRGSVERVYDEFKKEAERRRR